MESFGPWITPPMTCTPMPQQRDEEIYRSSSVGFTKWMVPTVVNGKVYVGSQKKLSVFGLF